MLQPKTLFNWLKQQKQPRNTFNFSNSKTKTTKDNLEELKRVKQQKMQCNNRKQFKHDNKNDSPTMHKEPKSR